MCPWNATPPGDPGGIALVDMTAEKLAVLGHRVVLVARVAGQDSNLRPLGVFRGGLPKFGHKITNLGTDDIHCWQASHRIALPRKSS